MTLPSQHLPETHQLDASQVKSNGAYDLLQAFPRNSFQTWADSPPWRNQPIHSLYLHVPFCFHKCHYCDFYSLADADISDSGRQRHFLLRLMRELDLRATQLTIEPQTIFVGGGTPTLLRPDLWQQLLEHLKRLNILGRVTEFTVEANPETVNPQLLSVLVAGGVNRISIGCQSFQPHLLKTLERWHEPDNVARAVHMARDAGITNINLDLIFAIPGQTIAQLDLDLDAALALNPDHLSCYGLTYEPNTAMTQRLKLGHVVPADEDLEKQMYARVIDRLRRAGFEHYEISNWARLSPERSNRCRHNLNYWHNLHWLGAGPAAASHIAGHRWKNVPHLGHYLDSANEPPITDQEHLPAPRRIGEELLLRLRLLDGVELLWLRQNLPDTDPRWDSMEHLFQIHMLYDTHTHRRLTPQGLFVADAVIAQLL